MKHRFKPSLTVYIFSAIGILGGFSLLYAATTSQDIFSIIVATIFITIIIYIIAKAPLYTQIYEDKIIIKRVIGKKTISPIKGIQVVSNKQLAQCIRTFGNGGLFYYSGKFWSPELGSFNTLAINLKQVVLVSTSTNKKYLINYPPTLEKFNTKGLVKHYKNPSQAK